MLKINYEYIKKDSPVTLVFLHGWGQSGNSFNKIINYISSNNSILKLDLPGFGLSEEPKEYFDTQEYAYQIFLLLNKLSIKNVILIGHSFGGRLSILLASVYDINIEHLVLTSSAGLNKFNLFRWLKIKKYKLVKWLVKHNILNKKSLNKYGSRDYKNSNNNLKVVMTKIVNQDLRKFAKKISAKTLLVWDKKDKETKYWICKKLRKYIENSKIIVFKNGGHFTAFKNANKFSNIISNI